MFDFQEKRKIRNLIYSKFSIAVILFFTIWLSVSVFERFKVEREMAEKKDQKEIELDILRARAEALGSRIDRLQNKRGIEEEIRNRFDAAKEGEQVVIIVDDTKENGGADLTNQTRVPVATSTDEGKRSPWSIFKFW